MHINVYFEMEREIYIYKKGEEFIEIIKKKIAFWTINNTHVSICIESCKIIVIKNDIMHINIYIKYNY